jgi:hypothetical protein
MVLADCATTASWREWVAVVHGCRHAHDVGALVQLSQLKVEGHLQPGCVHVLALVQCCCA